MNIRMTQACDWPLLKQARQAALLDAPTAFGVSYHAAVENSDERWQALASPDSSPLFWLALDEHRPVGLIGAGISPSGRFNLIAMWVEPGARGTGIASRLVETVLNHARDARYADVYLDVSPQNTQAAQLYLKHGFVFINEWEPLASHPHIHVQTMVWSDTDAQHA